MKPEESTVKAFKYAMSVIFETPVPAYAAALLFVLIGIVLVVVTKTSDRGRAFYSGLSVTAIIMTSAPQSIQPSITASTPATHTQAHISEIAVSDPSAIEPHGLLDFFLGAAHAQTSVRVATGTVALRLSTEDGRTTPPVTLSLRNPTTTALIARSRVATSSLTIRQAPGVYLVVIDADAGYEQYTAQVTVEANNTVEIAATLRPSQVPALVRRLTRMY